MTNGNYGELRIFTPNHEPVGVIPAKGKGFGWQRNQSTNGVFVTPQSGMFYNSKYLGLLNLVEYHHPDLPTAWLGQLIDHDPEPGGADIRLTCIDANSFYNLRYTDPWVQFIGNPGEYAKFLHEQATQNESLYGITVGEVEQGGPEYYQLYQLKAVGEALKDFADQSGGDFWVEKTGNTHRAPWALRWANNRGRNLVGSVCVSGEVVSPSFKKTGTNIRTFAHAIGGGTGNELWQRLYLPIPHRAAMRVYGRREIRLEYADVIDPVLLREVAMRDLNRLVKPEITIGFNVDNRNQVWGSFWLGDIIRVILYGVDFLGFDGAVRVEAIQIDEDTGNLGLTVEVV